MLKIRYYVAAGGHQPFAEWFADLDPVARAKVVRAIARMEQGNLANWQSFRRNDMFLNQLRHFLACCSGAEDARTTLVDGARSLKIALAVLRSLDSGRVEDVGT